MVASYRKEPYCLTCRNKPLGDESERNAHAQLGHRTEYYVVGGYAPVQENIEPLQPPKKEEKIKLNLCDMEEQGFFPDIEEGGQR